MADGIEAKLEGVDDLKRALSGAAKDIRTKAVRGGLRAGGRVFQAAARAAAPVLKVPQKNRKPGTIRRNIVVRGSKQARRDGGEGVYISVRGIRGKARVKRLGKAGAQNPNDPYYWRWVELGTKKMPGTRFLTRSAENNVSQATSAFMSTAIAQIEKLNNRK